MSTICAYCKSPHGPLSWFNGLPLSVCQDCRKDKNIEYKNSSLHYNTCSYEGCKALVNKCDCDNLNQPHNKQLCWTCELNMGYYFK